MLLRKIEDLTDQQRQNTHLLNSEEKESYSEWLSLRNYEGGTVTQWKLDISCRKIKLKKIDQWTPEQLLNTKGFINTEFLEYSIYLAKRGYEGGTVLEWQRERLNDINTKKEVPVLVRGDGSEGPYVARKRQ